MSQPDVVVLERWTGPVPDEDPHANFKREVAAGALVDPLPTLRNLAEYVGLPIGVVARHALVKWASAGSDALLEVGPAWIRRLAEPVGRAEAAGTDEARLAAYTELRDLLGWLAAGLSQGPYDRAPTRPGVGQGPHGLEEPAVGAPGGAAEPPEASQGVRSTP